MRISVVWRTAVADHALLVHAAVLLLNNCEHPAFSMLMVEAGIRIVNMASFNAEHVP
jgi:hypothetical protein